MANAGLFAGEVTQAAPADGAVTSKQKGFQWMEYGNVYEAPSNCNAVWNIPGLLTPDLHVSGQDGSGVWDESMLIGTGSLVDARGTAIFLSNTTDEYDEIGTGLPSACNIIDCQRYMYSGVNLANNLAGSTCDLTSWTKTGTGTVTFDQIGINGAANEASLLDDTDTGGSYLVSRLGPVNKTTLNGNPMSACIIVGKDITKTHDSAFVLTTSAGSNSVTAVFNQATGAISIASSVGTNPAAEVIDRGDWWEVYIGIDKDTGGTLTRSEIFLVPASPSSAIGTLVVGTVWIYPDRAIGGVRGAGTNRAIGSASPSLNIFISETNIPISNHDNTEGGYYIEWKPMFDRDEITGDVEILSLNGASGLLYYNWTTQELTATDGTNTATVPLSIVHDTKYRLGVAFGSSKMSVGVDAVWGSETAYDGAFALGTQFDIFRNPEAINYWRELRGYQLSYTESINEITTLMLG